MSTTREQAKREIADLIAKYKRLDSRAIKAYNEANTCKDFILPLFRALGWDVYNSAEVSAERKVSRGRVDYAFRLGGIPKFFLEAKKFAVDLNEPRWARQAINYAWIKGVTWAVLTDFEGLKVFNAEWKERNPLLNIFIDLTYDQYLEEFDRLWLLSKEAMQEGLIDREALRVGKKLKKRPVGEQLFGELVRWREKLHYYLRRYNPDFSDDQIDEAVQRILDRLIFIRTCEDRGIEAPRLRPLLRGWRIEGRRKDLVKLLSGIFRDFDEGYDARLFAPHFSEKLSCEPGPFEEVIEGLYATPDGIIEYDFNAIDVDVLGGIYEQYLGYVAKVVERRERREEPLTVEVIERKGWRKKHGIYYTPQFVVRYIVANTLGRLLEERTYNEVRQLKVLDPACGSGSFLIEAFDVLDKYHQRVRGDHDEFDFFRRAEILTSNIYGVDLDAQAVEIARLNLLLKTLNQRARLPDLANNIRQGNSLISGTPEELREYFGENWEEKKPFNWEEEFPQIMASGGFDVVIGNPPYVRIQTLDKDEVAFYNDHYEAATGNYDIYTLFVERGLKLLRPGGVFGMILPNKFMQARYGKGLRKLLSDAKAVWKVVNFEDAQVFEEATTYTCLLFLQKAPSPKVLYIPAGDYLKEHADRPNLTEVEPLAFPAEPKRLTAAPWVFVSKRESELMDRLAAAGPTLGEIAEKLFAGLQTSADSIYILKQRGKARNGIVKVYSRATKKEHELEAGLLKPIVLGRHVRRYRIDYAGQFVIFPYAVTSEGAKLIPASELAKNFPRTWAYLELNRQALEGREGGKMAHAMWYAYTYPRNLEQFGLVKLVNASMGTRAAFAFDELGTYSFVGGGSGVYGTILKPGFSYHYILGLLNSKLLDFYFKQLGSRFRGGFYVYRPQYIGQLPIRRIDFDNPEEKKVHDDLVALVERMLKLNKRLRETVGREREELERKIEKTDAEIDALVYELYGLTGKEVAVVENVLNRG